MTPKADVIIAVHETSRPIARAVGSVLHATDAPVRVTVVAHGVETASIEEKLVEFDGRALRIVGFTDGVASPAGPFNAGLAAAEAPFFSIMGSDDSLEPGAIDSWLRVAESDTADAVVARLRDANGRYVATPPTRIGRHRRLDGVRDRLSYRSAPLGLFSRERYGALRFTEGVPTGEDLAYVTAIWFSTSRISYDRNGPAYLIHADAEDRTSSAPRAISDEFIWWRSLDAADSWSELPSEQRAAAIAKFLRVHLFGAVFNRPDPQGWTTLDRQDLAHVAEEMIDAGSGIHETLSRRDRDLLDAILNPSVPSAGMIAAARARRAFTHPDAIRPRQLRYMFHPQGALRTAAASWMQTLG